MILRAVGSTGAQHIRFGALQVANIRKRASQTIHPTKNDVNSVFTVRVEIGPRAANLISNGVQQYSDRELFWIAKNGIRLSGMPAFAKVETDEHIWSLIEYLRALPRSDSINSP